MIIIFSDLQESKGNIGVAIDEMPSLRGLGSCPCSQPLAPNAPGCSREEGRFPFDQKFRDFRSETEWNDKSCGKCFRKFRNSNRLRCSRQNNSDWSSPLSRTVLFLWICVGTNSQTELFLDLRRILSNQTEPLALAQLIDSQGSVKSSSRHQKPV